MRSASLYGIRKKKERKKMEKVTHTNDFIASLPRIRCKLIWNVVMDGKIVQAVSATDNMEDTASAYIASKYPGKKFRLVFAGYKSSVEK